MNSAIRAHREAEDGFTLIELLVVVIIIGILAAIAIPAFLNQREGAWRSSVESDLRNAAIQMETYYAEADAYPATDSAFSEGDASGLTPAMDLQLSNGTRATDAATDTTPAIVYVNNGDGTYCMSAFHVELDGVVASYNSSTGGIDATATACTVPTP